MFEKPRNVSKLYDFKDSQYPDLRRLQRFYVENSVAYQ